MCGVPLRGAPGADLHPIGRKRRSVLKRGQAGLRCEEPGSAHFIEPEVGLPLLLRVRGGAGPPSPAPAGKAGTSRTKY